MCRTIYIQYAAKIAKASRAAVFKYSKPPHWRESNRGYRTMEALRGGSPHLPGRATAHLSLVGGRAVRSRDHHKGWAGLRGAADVGRQRAAWDARAAAFFFKPVFTS
eukprot:scaffold72574_cov67-Phaeocystis_antarctica.AAC.6